MILSVSLSPAILSVSKCSPSLSISVSNIRHNFCDTLPYLGRCLRRPLAQFGIQLFR